MATYKFEDYASYNEAEEVLAFKPGTDILRFDSALVLPTDVWFVGYGPYFAVGVTMGPSAGMYVQLAAGWGRLTSTNIQFASGEGKIHFGDNLASTNGDNAANTINGTIYDDALAGLGGNDTINAGNGDDKIFMYPGGAGYGTDSIDGGAGYDVLVFLTAANEGGVSPNSAPTSAINLNFATGTLSGGYASSGATIANIEDVVATDYNDTLTGGAGAEVFEGRGGNDTIAGGNGNDELMGSWGNDYLKGGGGSDRLYGDAGNDRLWGDAGADRLWGGTGADTLYWIIAAPETLADGGGGTDTLQLTGPGGTLDLTGLAGTKLKGIEKINLAGAADYLLEFSAAELDALSSSSTKLVVTGGEGDVVNSMSEGWVQGADEGAYHTYTKGELELWVDMEIGGTIS